jgi:putative tryptophan/tyrosine transport system substrate-binding protein
VRHVTDAYSGAIMTMMCSRRRFIQAGVAMSGLTLLTGCSRLPALSQAGRVPRIGVVTGSAADRESLTFIAVRLGLRDHGYEEGRNILVEWRALDNRPERAPEVVDELLRLGVDAIIGSSPPIILAAKRATTTVPIIMAGVFVDPVGQGAVRNLSRPGENVTGMSVGVPTLGNKRIEMLKEAVPAVGRLGMLWDRTLGQTVVDAIPAREAAARAVGMEPHSIVVERAAEIPPAIDAMKAAGAEALHVSDGGLHANQSQVIADLALKHQLPSICGFPQLVRVGLMLELGIDQVDLQRRSVGHLDKILKGANPGDLPVEQPTAFDIIVNLKTAQALGVTIPQAILAQATEIIQ